MDDEGTRQETAMNANAKKAKTHTRESLAARSMNDLFFIAWNLDVCAQHTWTRGMVTAAILVAQKARRVRG